MLLELPEAENQAARAMRLEWDSTCLRDNLEQRVFNADQSRTGTRSQHRKTHLVTWRVKHGVSKRNQVEFEAVYKAFRQHTHRDGDTHDRNDDGDFERRLLGWSHQLLLESEHSPAARLRGGVLLPRRAETEGIGQEAGFDLLVASGKQLGNVRLSGMLGFAMTFDNHEHPADPDFGNMPISKGHVLRALRYGIGLSHPLDERWQANVELAGRVFDPIELNQRVHESELTLTPGVISTSAHEGRWDSWIGFGLHIGLTEETDHIGVAIRTGARF